GLSLSRSVVQQHGGRLFLDETFTKGAQFVLQLPAEEVAEEAPGAPVSESPPASSQRRILIVDDQQDLLEMMAAALGMRGYHADMAATGSHALDLLKGATYDLAVLDVLLPGELGGPELYQIMRGANPDLAGRTMFVTGDTMNFETRQFLEQIGRPYLEKPFLVSNFVDRVEQLLAIQ
ncbi:MAG: two-component system, NtrC family, sensor kinase, partial [Candidatus Hydrogenedentes bacterium]|nr:two-component system, NtrC family, sensor kinase [Candidatus Hydrogenedentota bacterium]